MCCMAARQKTPDPIPAWSVGDRLRKARERAHIGVGEMAERLGRERNTITRWERSPIAQTMVIRLYAIETGVPEWWLQGQNGPDDTTESSVGERVSSGRFLTELLLAS